MVFPVDLLENGSHEELETSAEDYMADLRCGDPENPEVFSFLNITIPVSLSTVGFVPLYGGDQTQKVLALFAPEDSLTGSVCASFLTQSYQLPVLDTMFVRKKYRGKDFGLHVLEDFVDSFTEDALGLRYPLSLLMSTACKQYFEKYPGDHELLWEVEGVGHWYQRVPVTRALQRESLKLTAVSQTEAKRPTLGEYGLASVPGYEAKIGDRPSGDVQRTIDSLKDTFASTSEGHSSKAPVSTRSRSGHLKRPKIGKRFQDPEFSTSQGDEEKTPQTSPAAAINKFESAARTSESSDDSLEEPEESVAELEDESGDKDTQPAPEGQPRLEKQAGGKESELEPMNGEVMEDTLKTSLVTEEDDSTIDVLDEELKLQSLDSSEDSLNLVPLVVDASKPSEAVVQDKSPHITDSAPLAEESASEDKGHAEEKLPLASRKKAHLGSSDDAATTPNEERSDSGFPNSVVTEFSEESISENVSPNTASSVEDPGEEGVSEPQETSLALQQSSLMEVELEDVPCSQTAGQKSQSEEQSEASSEHLDPCPPSADKAVDSSSEETELEVPVVDRRSLRRKAKGHKGPAKKKAKLT
ncbi:soluble lamin-associated protein of 75 kDa isoform X2 [Tenrec ecaudatus]|uniref:soluble lamin-associated protein of 75 kDa isoform X2 n=1 Tax=Tenrec ecaudatus TaxID=94439 RepID=UPI003F5A9EB4